MIIAVGSDKGSPGATTLAMVLGMVWPGERVVCELDPRGADLPYRMHARCGGPLAASPSVATLAVDCRAGATQRPLLAYAQPTAAGIPVIAGEVSARRFARLAEHLPAIGSTLAAWPGTVIMDLGCLSPPSHTLRLAKLATVVLLVTRADTESLGRLRERAEELTAELGGSHLTRTPVAVVVRAPRSETGAASARVVKLLQSVGSPVQVLGTLPDDPAAVAGVCTGALSRRARHAGLVRSVREVADQLQAVWPELTGPIPAATAASSPTADSAR